MSNLVFPDLPGLTWDFKPVPTFSVDKQVSKNGAVTALVNDPFPKWNFELSYEFLRGSRPPKPSTANPRSYSELDQITGLFMQSYGSAGTFLLDPGLVTGNADDWQVHGAPLGVGDGVTTTFYLQRDCGGFMDEVQDPVGTVTVSVAGVQQAPTAFTLGSVGDVTFAVAPAAGAVVTASFRWRWRVRFAEDSLGLEGFLYQLYELQSVKLEQDKR